jgi:hypothetical protein
MVLDALLSHEQDGGGADTLLPALVFVLIQANPPQLWTSIQFIRDFRNKSFKVEFVFSLLFQPWLTHFISREHSLSKEGFFCVCVFSCGPKRYYLVSLESTIGFVESLTVADLVGLTEVELEENKRRTLAGELRKWQVCSSFDFFFVP